MLNIHFSSVTGGQLVLKETLLTIMRKRTVSNEVTGGVKEAALILTQLRTHHKTWKDARRRLAIVKIKERARLTEELRQSEQVRKEASQLKTAKTKKKKPSQNEGELFSPPKGPESLLPKKRQLFTVRSRPEAILLLAAMRPKKGKTCYRHQKKERDQKKKEESETGVHSKETPFTTVKGKRKKR